MVYFDDAGGPGSLTAEHEFAGVWDPFCLIWSVVEGAHQVLHYLWSFSAVHVVVIVLFVCEI